MPKGESVAAEKGMKGLDPKTRRAKAVMAAAAKAAEPLAAGFKQSARMASPALTAEHAAEFEARKDSAFDDVHREESGLLTEEGFLLSQEIEPTAFVVSADLRGLKPMNDLFSKEGADQILEAFSMLMANHGGTNFNAAHPHGDEYYAGSNDRAALDGFFKDLRELAKLQVFAMRLSDGRVALQEGVEFAYGIGTSLDDADRIQLPAAKEQQGPVPAPRILSRAEFDAVRGSLEDAGRGRKLLDISEAALRVDEQGLRNREGGATGKGSSAEVGPASLFQTASIRSGKEQLEFSTDYKADVRLPMAAVMLGPKLGAFYANLMGADGYLTMDRWWSRTFNRYRGQLIPAATRSGLDRFKELLGNPKMDDEEAILHTAEHRNTYEARNFKRGTEIEKAANTIYKAEFEELEDTPFNATDRSFMLDTVRQAQAELSGRGHKVSVADIQAILWYYEKRLYSELGARSSADVSYQEVATRIVEERASEGKQRRDGPGGRPAQGVRKSPNREVRGVDGGVFEVPDGDQEGRLNQSEMPSAPAPVWYSAVAKVVDKKRAIGKGDAKAKANLFRAFYRTAAAGFGHEVEAREIAARPSSRVRNDLLRAGRMFHEIRHLASGLPSNPTWGTSILRRRLRSGGDGEARRMARLRAKTTAPILANSGAPKLRRMERRASQGGQEGRSHHAPHQTNQRRRTGRPRHRQRLPCRGSTHRP